MKNKKKILILGVGNAQIDAIKLCKELGFKVFAISYRDEGLGRKFADKFDVINIIDKNAVLEYVNENKIDIIYSVGSDIAMPTVGYVSEETGKPLLVSETIAELLQNKGFLRNFLMENNLSPVPFKTFSKIDEVLNWKLFPAIIKPVDSQGQRGIYEVNNFEDVKKYFPEAIKHSQAKEVIIEKYINGPEISVNSFVYNGEVIYNFITDRFVVENEPGGIVCGHRLPSKSPKLIQKKTDELTKKIIAALKIKNGPVYFQLKYTSDDVFVIEITPRFDGCHIWRLIKSKYNIDLLTLTFNLLNNNLKIYENEFKAPNSQYIEPLRIDFFLQKPGTPAEINSEKNEKLLYKEWYYSNGEIVRPINGHLDKTGYQISIEKT